MRPNNATQSLIVKMNILLIYQKVTFGIGRLVHVCTSTFQLICYGIVSLCMHNNIYPFTTNCFVPLIFLIYKVLKVIVYAPIIIIPVSTLIS